MSLRRIFLLGAATLVSVAALVAIATILSGDFGETEGKILADARDCLWSLERRRSRASRASSNPCRGRSVCSASLSRRSGSSSWNDQIWEEHHSGGYWKLLGLLLMLDPRRSGGDDDASNDPLPTTPPQPFPGTVAAAVAAGLTVSTMVLGENGDGWQLFAVLLVLALLGEMLTPILQRVANAPAGGGPSERILGEIAGVVVVAARGRQGERSVLLGNREVPLADDERIVIRPA